MSKDERNTLAWPSIEQLPRVVAERVGRFLSVADAAALIIQRAHRGTKPDGSADLRGGKRSRLRSLLFGSSVSVAEKLDGTNVGVLQDSTLLGRRLVIAQEATSYQHTDLGALRALPTRDMIAELVALGGAASVAVERAALYGELCCNSGLYSYQASGLAKTWQAFGALLEFRDEASALEYAAAASATGIMCNSEETSRVVRVCDSEEFVNMARRHGVPVVAAVAHGSLAAAVESHRQWMVGEHGEGLVLTVHRDHGKASTYKWKISREPQPAATALLMELVELLRGGANGKAALLDAEIHTMLASLLAVATHVDSTAAAAAAKAAAQPKAPKKAAIVDPAAVQAALESALTKFDALETYLETQGQAATVGFADKLVEEMLADADLRLPADGDAAREAAVKVVSNAAKRHVGQQFGAWKKAKAPAAAS